MPTQTLESTLNTLQYNLDEIKRLPRRHCWIHYEYKFDTLAGGIAKLKSIQETSHPHYRKDIDNLLSQYLNAFQTIL